jgi:hypothetical protein
LKQHEIILSGGLNYREDLDRMSGEVPVYAPHLDPGIGGRSDHVICDKSRRCGDS